MNNIEQCTFKHKVGEVEHLEECLINTFLSDVICESCAYIQPRRAGLIYTRKHHRDNDYNYHGVEGESFLADCYPLRFCHFASVDCLKEFSDRVNDDDQIYVQAELEK